ncbi:MAG: AIR synthase related protein, partial [Alphaproteobacteria bacterium]|nr:AIR synthase related protein [Alphaproteobacteria bacterium]
PDNSDPMAALRTILGGPAGASRRWIWEQYDHTVMGDTVGGPGGDAAVVRIHGTGRGLALTSDCTPRYCLADPVEGGRQAVAEAWRNLTAVGAAPLAVTDNLNFGDPERPEVMGQFVGCVRGMGEACLALDFPVVSGNVSLYNETNGRAVLPTPVVGAVGLLDDLAGRVGMALPGPGLALVLVGETRGHLGRSLWLETVEGREEGPPPPVNLAAERCNGDFVRAEIRAGRIAACHDLSDGGLLVAAAEMALAGGVGVTLSSPLADAVAGLFGEDQARYLLAVENPDEMLKRAAAAGVSTMRIGETGGGALTVEGHSSISLDELHGLHEGWMPAWIAGG